MEEHEHDEHVQVNESELQQVGEQGSTTFFCCLFGVVCNESGIDQRDESLEMDMVDGVDCIFV
jgi:hypothetical protein